MDKESRAWMAQTFTGGDAMFFLGIDVSKVKLDCSLLLDASGGKHRSKVVPNTTEGIRMLLAWVGKQVKQASPEVHAVMESTGVYHQVAAQTLFDAGVRVSVANPAQVKHFGKGLAVRTKTDGSDATVLARYGALTSPALWQPPAPEVRVLDALIGRIEAIEADLHREENRLEKAMVSNAPKLIVDSIRTGIDFLTKQRDELVKVIGDHIDRHPTLSGDKELLLSIPAVGEKTANRMLSVLHSRDFASAEQTAAFLGLIPIERQSGTSLLMKPRLSKAGNPRVRSLLFMAAVVAVRYNPDIRALYIRLLARGKSKMSAIGAAMRKLVHICYGVVKHQTPYRVGGHLSLEKP